MRNYQYIFRKIKKLFKKPTFKKLDKKVSLEDYPLLLEQTSSDGVIPFNECLHCGRTYKNTHGLNIHIKKIHRIDS